MTVLDFFERKKNNQKISMVTCYDSTFAKIVDESDVDTILIGDSCAMVMHGESTTLPATIEMMEAHTKAVRKNCKKFIVADMPFLATRKGFAYATECAGKLLCAGANAVKIERISTQKEIISHLIDSGIPVMAHLGLTPQFYNTLGGHRRQGKTDESWNKILEEAKLAQELKCFSVLLECVPPELATEITKTLNVATIGIGCGTGTDGQVLVLQDLLGLNKNPPPFAKKFADGFEVFRNALNEYHCQVRS